jgi:hypothetical protein
MQCVQAGSLPSHLIFFFLHMSQAWRRVSALLTNMSRRATAGERGNSPSRSSSSWPPGRLPSAQWDQRPCAARAAVRACHRVDRCRRSEAAGSSIAADASQESGSRPDRPGGAPWWRDWGPTRRACISRGYPEGAGRTGACWGGRRAGASGGVVAVSHGWFVIGGGAGGGG